MIKFLRSIPKQLGAAVVSLRRHMAMAISSASAMLVTLLVMGVLLIVAGNLSGFAQRIENELSVHASIDSLADTAAIEAMEQTIRSWEEVKQVTFSSSEQELETLIEENGSVFARYRDRNPMPNVFIVEVKTGQDIPVVSERLNVLEGIEKAEYGGESITAMLDGFAMVRTGGVILIIALGLLALFLIMNTIKMTIYTRMKEISIMRNVGAANWYIRTPFVFEGMCIGFAGAFLPAFVCVGGYALLYGAIQGRLVSDMLVLQPIYPFAWSIAACLLGCGVLVGMLGSFLAVTKYLRWRR